MDYVVDVDSAIDWFIEATDDEQALFFDTVGRRVLEGKEWDGSMSATFQIDGIKKRMTNNGKRFIERINNAPDN